MSLSLALILVALVGAVLALTQHSERVVPALAVLAAALEAGLAFGVVSLSVRHLPLGLLLAGALLVCGAVIWMRAASKAAISGATAVAIVGAAQLLSALHVLR